MKKTYILLSPHLEERMRGLWGAAQAQAIGHGGITKVQVVTGLSRPCLTRGMKDLAASPLSAGAVCEPGGGRKGVTEHEPTLLAALGGGSEPTQRGDPRRGLRWTCKSTRTLAQELTTHGHAVSHTTVAEELPLQQYRRQGNRKPQEGAAHPDRNAQCLYLPETASAVQHRGDPVIAIDTTKKALLGNSKNGGPEGAPKGGPRTGKVYDFLDQQLGTALPSGGYERAQNNGFVSVGLAQAMGEFAVQPIRRWWTCGGRAAYPQAKQLSLTADGGGSNASRSRLFTLELPQVAAETPLRIRVSP